MSVEIDYSAFEPVKDDNPLWEKMNTDAIMWFCAETPEMKQKYRNELLIGLYKYYGMMDADNIDSRNDEGIEYFSMAEPGDEILYFFTGNEKGNDTKFDKFNPRITTFSRYYHQMRTYIHSSLKQKENGAVYKKFSDEERIQLQKEYNNNGVNKTVPKAKHVYNNCISYEEYEQTIINEEKNVPDTLEYPRSVEEYVIFKDEKEQELNRLIAAALDIPGMLGRKSGNPVKCIYFKMFFTSEVSSSIRASTDVTAYLRSEKTLFKAMALSFLDFTLVNICRTVREIRSSHLKLYSEMIEGAPDIYPEDKNGNEKLGSDIYCAYLKNIEGIKSASEVAVSTYKKQYEEFKKLANGE